jgi:hypothetical protein
VRQAIWLRGFLEELGFSQLEPTVLYTDSQSAMAPLINSFRVSNNSAHFIMRLNYYLHEVVEQKLIKLAFIDIKQDIILTKLLSIEPHEFFMDTLTLGHHGISPYAHPKVVVKSKRINKFKQDKDTNQRIYKFTKLNSTLQSPTNRTEGTKEM